MSMAASTTTTCGLVALYKTMGSVSYGSNTGLRGNVPDEEHT